MKNIIPLVAATTVALLLSACADQGAGSGPAHGPPEVVAVTLEPQDITLVTELPGRTRPYLVAEVRPQVGGILLKRMFEEGSDVKAGQVLYQIDPAPYRATLARNEASLESAKLLAERYEQLLLSKAISQQDRDDARSQFLQARASTETARIDLGYTSITAPISGRIGRSSVTQGALLTANQADALATVHQLDPIYVDIVQPSSAILKLREDLASGHLKSMGEGQVEVALKLENGKQYGHPGTLKFSEVSVDEGTSAVTLRAVFPNPDGVLMPGMFVHANLQAGVRSQVLLVPQRGITRDTVGNATAMVVDAEGKAQLRQVEVERSYGNFWMVSSGLSAGDQVIVDGLQSVKVGAAVKVAPAADASAQPAAPATH